jgi:hypothetical protein
MTLWRHVIEEQLSETQRALLLVRASLSSEPVVAVPVLFDAAQGLLRAMGQSPAKERDLVKELHVLEGDLLRTERSLNHPVAVVLALDPGLADALLEYTATDPEAVMGILGSAQFFEQDEWILGVLGRRTAGQKGLRSPEQSFESEVMRALCRTVGKPDPEQEYFLSRSGTRAGRPFFRDLGRRLKVIRTLADSTGLDCVDTDLAEALRIGRPKEQSMAVSEGVSILRQLASSSRPSWRRWRTELSLTLLHRVEEMDDDVETFKDLASVVEAIDVGDLWLADMRDRFEEWAGSELDDISSLLEVKDDEVDDSDLDDAQTRFTDIAELAETLDAYLGGLDDVSERIEELTAEPEEPTASRKSSQSVGFPESGSLADIFNKF